jgi:PncC family amidohydrolase
MSLNKNIVLLIKKKKIKLAIAESCTGGMLSSAITTISGSSKIFTMGLVTYSNQSKLSILKIPQKIIKKYGAVSVQCCLAMVNNLSKISKSKVCVSITGIAGPKGGSKQKPVGLVYIGIRIGKKVVINKCNFKNKGRVYIQKQTVKKSLNLLFKLIK